MSDKFVWIGPAGYNPIVGSVKEGQEITISGDDLDRLLQNGLVKKQKTKSTKE